MKLRHEVLPQGRDGHTLRAESSPRVLDGERPMPRPLPVPVRQAIWRRFQDGQDGPTIAQALGLAAAHRPASAGPLPSWRSGPPGSFLRPMRSGDTQARRIPRASRPRTASPTSDLGRRLDPRDACAINSPTTRCRPSGRSNDGSSAPACRPRRWDDAPPPTHDGPSGLTRSGKWTRPSW